MIRSHPSARHHTRFEKLREQDVELSRARRYNDESAEKLEAAWKANRDLESEKEEKDAEIKRLRKEMLEMGEKLKKA